MAELPMLWRERLIAQLEERGPEWVSNVKLVPRPHGMLLSPNFPGYEQPDMVIKQLALGS